MARNDPLRNFRFRLEIDSITQAGFSEVAIGETTTEPIDYREGTDPTHVRKLSGLTKYGNITLKWGVTDSHRALQLAQGRRRRPDQGPAQEGDDHRHRRGRRRQGALRRHRGVADQIRPQRPQRQGQRGVHRAARARQRRHRARRVNRSQTMDRHRIVRVSGPRSSSRCPRATSTRPACCTATA